MAILPIVTYDDPILRAETEPLISMTEDIRQLIDDMFDTMYNASGVGLAAPQIGKTIQLFVMDAEPMAEKDDEMRYLGPSVFINPQIVNISETETDMEEGCLSIPTVTEMVTRPQKITVSFYDRNFHEQELTCRGWNARIIQHETDHLHGKLFIDYLSSFKKRLISRSLNKIAQGKQECNYPLRPKVNSAHS